MKRHLLFHFFIMLFFGFLELLPSDKRATKNKRRHAHKISIENKAKKVKFDNEDTKESEDTTEEKSFTFDKKLSTSDQIKSVQWCSNPKIISDTINNCVDDFWKIFNLYNDPVLKKLNDSEIKKECKNI